MGLIEFIPNEEIDKMKEENNQIEVRVKSSAELDLVNYIKHCWQEAREYKKREIEPRLIKCKLNREGKYDAETLAEIRKIGGSEIFMMLTDEKCNAAESWLLDILTGKFEDIWDIDTTEVVELPEIKKIEIFQELMQKLYEDIQQGLITEEDLKEDAERIYSELRKESKIYANDEIKKVKKYIKDYIQEANLMEALEDVIIDGIQYPCGFLKFPIIRKKNKLKWVNGEIKTVPEIVVDAERVSPFDIYPSPNATDINDGYLFERHKLTRADLLNLKGVDGYRDDEIDAVIEEFEFGQLNNWLDPEVISEDDIDKEKEAYVSEKIDALQFWGSVNGLKLKDYGLNVESNLEYEIEAWIIGDHVIKLVLNKYPLWRKPYHKWSFRKIPGEFWGLGLPELIEDCQRACNAAARNLVNNMAIASAPQVAIDTNALPAGESITSMYPWKIWQFTKPTQNSIMFFQPNPMINELLKVYEFFSNEADNKTGIPKYSYGVGAGSGALSTATGFTMMMNNATRGIKRVVKNIDRLIKSAIKSIYDWIQLNDPIPDFHGDLDVVVKGSKALLEREYLQMRRNEFMQIILSRPELLSIIGAEGLVSMLRAMAEGLKFDIGDIVPDKVEFEKRVEALRRKQMEGMMSQMGGQTSPNIPNNQPELDNAGNTAGGKDANIIA